MRAEINPVPLMRACRRAGADARPAGRAGRGKPLIMRAWDFGAPLKAGVWGIREPRPMRPRYCPDMLIVPLAAFDRAGHRIGYGAGYYDMTITRCAPSSR